MESSNTVIMNKIKNITEYLYIRFHYVLWLQITIEAFAMQWTAGT